MPLFIFTRFMIENEEWTQLVNKRLTAFEPIIIGGLTQLPVECRDMTNNAMPLQQGCRGERFCWADFEQSQCHRQLSETKNSLMFCYFLPTWGDGVTGVTCKSRYSLCSLN